MKNRFVLLFPLLIVCKLFTCDPSDSPFWAKKAQFESIASGYADIPVSEYEQKSKQHGTQMAIRAIRDNNLYILKAICKSLEYHPMYNDMQKAIAVHPNYRLENEDF